MNKLSRMLSVAALAGLIVSSAAAEIADSPISIEGGKIVGGPSDVAGVTIYKAVPFAAPPVGADRWKAPQPVVPWSGIRDSSAWPNRCYQLASANPPGSFYFNEYYWDPSKDPRDSEDCLYLNIWAPTKPATGALPVMVYYHGGGNRHGNNSEVEFNASRLAAKGIIVVSAAYRLNIMGFLALPGMGEQGAGNFAILDAVEALKWVNKNIGAFGGDPGRVTIAGQSAGSRNVRSILSTPLAKGLFQRAIMHSSPTVMAQPGKPNYLTLADKTNAAAPVFQKYFPGKSLDDLRKLPAEEFYRDPARIDEMYAVTSNMYAVIDGTVLTADSVDLLKEGALNGIDVIVGTVADERTALDGAPDKVMEIPAFHAYWKKLLGEALYTKYAFEKLYPASTPRDAYRQHLKAQADLLLEQNRIAGALLTARNPSSKVYVYYFDHPTPGRDREFYGAWHSSDLWYTFNSLRNEPGQRQWAPYDFELAEQASTMWANFVKAGDPNGVGLPTWPRSSRANDGAYLSFAETSTSATSASPYLGTSAERRNALFHDYEMTFYGINE
ncbi:carboxylesterase family protein [Bradyrhizobium sp. OK095]|uniref:carboxylesterase/lipase family protein n=1 Tax=Bradyrhizobium sp. OK095 TaxID=1882760 RepID=UPI0008D6BCE3|nr:carboxylesterase family protein [Bradyrhizobium sp. OK095]SEN83573.1 para-nitrobenzyl esterase [Bradyrhizobium sp. OK095]